MVFEITFHNDGGANDGKIALKVTDNEGVAGTHTAYWGLTAPDGTVIRNIATGVGTFAGSGTLTVYSDIPLDSEGAYLGGTYAIEGTVKTGVTTIANNSMDFTYDPRVAPGSSASDDAVVTAENSCSAGTITLTDSSLNTGYDVLSNNLSLTPPPTIALPSPDSSIVVGPSQALYTLGDGVYGYSTITTREIVVDADDQTPDPMTTTLSEVIVAVGSITVACATWCGAATAFDEGVVACNDSACADDWDLSKEQMIKIIQKLSYGMLALLKAKCGEDDEAIAALAKLTAQSSFCSCSC